MVKPGADMRQFRARWVLLILLWIPPNTSSQRHETSTTMNQDLRDLLAEMGVTSSTIGENHPFYSLTPSTPTPENINCYVEVPAVRVGGVCRRLGRSRRRGRMGRRYRNVPTWGCQAGVHLDIGSPDCSIFSRRSRLLGGG